MQFSALCIESEERRAENERSFRANFVKTNAVAFDGLFSLLEEENFPSSERQQERFLFPPFTTTVKALTDKLRSQSSVVSATRRRDGDQISPSLGLLSHVTKRGQSLQNSDYSFVATESSKSCVTFYEYHIPDFFIIVSSGAIILQIYIFIHFLCSYTCCIIKSI